jgi:hypothetical protein
VAFPVEIAYDSKWMSDYSSVYELREASNSSVKRERELDKLFYGTDSECSMLFSDVNNVK